MSELSEVRRELTAIRETVARTDTNVDWMRGAIELQVKRGDDHEKRIRWLERWGNWVSGAAGAVGVLLGIGGGNQLKP
jgi:hypothetical protein